MTSPDTEGFVRVGPADELRDQTPRVIRADGRSIGLFYHEDAFYATDNRCPHMGFPLTQGTIEAGVLTCPWHHARFELSCGDTFDPFADDVQTYPVVVRDGIVYVDPHPAREDPPDVHWEHRLEHGLRENIDLVIAKAVLGLHDAGVPKTVAVRIGTTFGCTYRAAGWGSGLTTLGVMTNLLPALDDQDQHRALYTGLTTVAADCAGEPPFFPQDPLTTDTVPPERLKAWFRHNIEVRDADGAERVLRAAIQAGRPQPELAGMLTAAATDHLYLDTGHLLDFTNKALETLDHIGWEHADTVLPALVPGLAAADRAEERASWRQPIDVAALCFEASDQLPDLLNAREPTPWEEPPGFTDALLGDDPHAITQTITTAIQDGATATDLALRVAYAAAQRIAQFGTSNEFRDWNTVHHTYSYANALVGVTRRTDAPEAYRGVYDAAMNVYLDRFLNTPPVPLPSPNGDRDPQEVLAELMEAFEIEADAEVDHAGRLTAEFLESGGSPDQLKRSLGTALLREDAGFHPRQNLEAAFSQYDALHPTDPDRAAVHLIGTARYLAAHTPTRRAAEQTFRIADRLNRGEKIHEQLE